MYIGLFNLDTYLSVNSNTYIQTHGTHKHMCLSTESEYSNYNRRLPLTNTVHLIQQLTTDCGLIFI